jgi:hypothetical protein
MLQRGRRLINKKLHKEQGGMLSLREEDSWTLDASVALKKSLEDIVDEISPRTTKSSTRTSTISTQASTITCDSVTLDSRTSSWMDTTSDDTPLDRTSSWGGSTSCNGDFSRASSEIGSTVSTATPRVVGECPRIGIDIGGVLTREGDPRYDGERWGNHWEAPGAFEAVRCVVQLFGPRNVFLVSKVILNRRMHRETKQWLKSQRFCERTGLPEENITFVSCASGPNGKGPAASRLGLSHFVDDKLEVLESVFSDPAGNSGMLVQKFDGCLFHFASGGSGRVPPRCPQSKILPDMRAYYCGVAGWAEVVESLRKNLSQYLSARLLVDA